MRCAVVGGGIIGLSIASRLASRGVEVLVYDAWAAASPALAPPPWASPSVASASGSSSGSVMPVGAQSKQAGERPGAWFVAAGMLAAGNESTWESAELGALMVESARRWPGFAAELGVRLPEDGTLVVALTADDVAEAEREWARQTDESARLGGTERLGAGERVGAAGRPGEFGQASAALVAEPGGRRLGPSGLRELEPALSPRVRAGCYLPGDWQVDPRKVVAALRERVSVVPGRVVDLGGIDADQVVVAAGVGTGALTGLPVRPVKGEVLRLRGEPGLLRHVVSGYADGRRVYLVPREDGEIVVGATQEERADDAVTAGAVLDLLRAAVDLVPALADCAITETLVGHRPSTPDNAPLLGRLDKRTVVAVGHHRNGVLLAPVTADLIAGLVVTGEPDPLIVPFAPGRFA
ncbi:FAD-dependent oxidoreductase [Actinoplanes sp. NPDC089786]|uniref:FAD-dependent oxidoreductase n=1 Tax=Actinoplanes sp. NPDC089786 TaxID=3155185 RepID=UPI00341E8B2B